MEDSQQQELLAYWLNDTSFINWAKNSSKGDVKKWNDYFQQHPEEQETGEIVKSIIIGLPITPTKQPISEQQIHQSWQKVIIKADQLQSKRQAITSKEKRINRIGWTIAASLLLLIGLSGWFLYTTNQKTAIYITTSAGEIKKAVLEDGSKVTLNANSTLIYFKQRPRTIQLKGEAFFDVVKNDGEKFVVQTNELTVEVLGTQFNVDANTINTNVYLKEGKVILNINETQEQIELQPGDLVTCTADKQINKIDAQQIEDTEIGWTTGSLVFKNKELKEVLSELERVYSIQFEINDTTINQKEVTTGLPINDLSLALEVLKSTLSLEFEPINQQQYKVKSLE